MFARLIPLFLAVPLAARAGGGPDLPLDRPYTLLNQEPARLQDEYRRMIEGDAPQSFLFPRPCRSDLDSARSCVDSGGFSFADTAKARRMRISPVAGYEYRWLDANVQAGDFGIVTEGASGPLSFYLDARMYTEHYDDLLHTSYDREFVERQSEQASGTLAYSSYSRYRSNLNYDWSWGRLTAARDAIHWGPGLFANLTFQEEAIPFNHMTFTTHLGPVSVQSVYGQLASSRDWEFDTSSDAKSLYAHRYEWRATPDLALGLSEQLILFKATAPFAFVPVIPLFITKASEKERLNNGNLAADISYRLPGVGMIYSEFLIDDIQSPTSLFNDMWSNKWAWMAGFHAIRDLAAFRAGLVAEYSRVEPWVYTHYIPHTAQTAHEDYPLGNPFGPNSQVIIADGYLALPGRWRASLGFLAVWKGTDLGSGIEDVHGNAPDTKEFLAGVTGPDLHLRPSAWYSFGRAMAYASADLGPGLTAAAGVQYLY